MPIIKAGTPDKEYAHIFIGTKPLQRIYVSGGTADTFTIGFTGRNIGQQDAIWTFSRLYNDGRNNTGTITPADPNRAILFMTYEPFGDDDVDDLYTFYLNATLTKEIDELVINGRAYMVDSGIFGRPTRLSGAPDHYIFSTDERLNLQSERVFSSNTSNNFKFGYRDDSGFLSVGSDKLIWQNTDPPAITGFSVSPGGLVSSHNITFERDSTVTGRWDFERWSGNTDNAGLISPVFNELAQVYFFDSNAPIENRNSYWFFINSSLADSDSIANVEINGRDYLVHKNALRSLGGIDYQFYTMNPNTVTNVSDRVSATNLTNTFRFKKSDNSYLNVPNPIDLDTRPTGTITFTVAVTGLTGKTTTAQIYKIPQNEKVGVDYQGINGSNISTTVPNIPQPTENQNYRLLAYNPGGASHKDIQVYVTQNATITNFVRAGFSQAPGLSAGTFIFTATITGYPQPTLSYRFGSGISGSITTRHLTRAAGTNTWTLRWDIYHAVLSDSLVLTATNSSNTVTATISNISA